MRRLGLFAVATMLLVAASTAFAGSSGSPSGTYYLDTYSPASTGYAAGKTTSGPLTNGKFYVAKVEGTYSAWTKWSSGRCGRVEAAPEWRTPGVEDAPVGDDAVFRFAKPKIDKNTCRDENLPRRTGVFRIDVGDGYYTPWSSVGSPPNPRNSHTYEFVLAGQGDPATFNLRDHKTNDNNGRLRISVREAVDSDCNGTKYQYFGTQTGSKFTPAFASANDCKAAI